MNDSLKHTQTLADEQATGQFAARLTAAVRPGLVIYLHGELGAGKTTLVRKLLTALGHQGRVKSPTYALVESYVLPLCPVHHFDLYRFADPQEWEDSGLRELFSADALCLIEWPDKAQGLLPAADWIIELTVTGPQARQLSLTAHSPSGSTCLNTLHQTPPAAD